MYYVIQVQSRHEEEIIEMIKKMVSNDLIIDIFSPSVEQKRKYKGDWRKITVKCFPGYVFVKTENPNELFKELYPVPAFTKLLGIGKTGERIFIPLTPQETYTLEALAGKNHDIELSEVVLEEGKIVEVLSGPLQGKVGQIVKLNAHKRLCTISIDMAGRKCEVTLGIDIVNQQKKD